MQPDIHTALHNPNNKVKPWFRAPSAVSASINAHGGCEY